MSGPLSWPAILPPDLAGVAGELSRDAADPALVLALTAALLLVVVLSARA